MKSLPEVSIVIPVYNVEKYLDECISSVTSQTYPNISIILVDDGSTDSSGRICDNYVKEGHDSRISVIHKANGGLSDARNAGMSEARGKYIYFLDSDDYIEKQAIEILTLISEQNQLDILSFDTNMFSEASCKPSISEGICTTLAYYPELMKGRELYLTSHKNHDYHPTTWLHFYNRDFLNKHNFTFKKGIIHEDELFTFITLMAAERVIRVPIALHNYRFRSGSIASRRKTQRNSDSLYTILDEVFEKYSRFHDNPDTKSAYEFCINDLALTYIDYYKRTQHIQDDRGREHFTSMMKKLKSLDYVNYSIIERHIKFWSLYLLKSKLSWNVVLRKVYNLARGTALRIIHRLKPDDECRDVIARLRYTNRPGYKRIIMLCVPRHGNRGDIAIALAERRLFTENSGYTLIEISGILCEEYSGLVRRYLNSGDILMITGGGFFGSLWRKEEISALKILRHFPKNKIIIMPQTIFYFDNEHGQKELSQDRKTFSRFKDLHVFVRDRNSYELVHSAGLFPNAKSITHVPDMACSMNFEGLAQENRSGVLVCLRPDIESALSNEERNELYTMLLREYDHLGFYSTNPPQSQVMIQDWDQALKESLRPVAGCELLVTDRLHGMIFAAITGTPCVAFDNLSGKVHSVYEWIAGCEYIQICRSINDFDEARHKAITSKRDWDNSRLMPHFNKILDLIRE